MIELNEELRQAVSEHPDEPLRLLDTATKQTFVLVRAEVFDRLHGLLFDAGEFDPDSAAALMNEAMAEDDKDDPLLESYLDDFDLRDTYPAQIASAMRAGWSDPEMSDYDNYDEAYRKRCQSTAAKSARAL